MTLNWELIRFDPPDSDPPEIVAIRARMQARQNIVIREFDPDEPRDDDGEWTSGGSGGGTTDAAATKATGAAKDSKHLGDGADKTTSDNKDVAAFLADQEVDIKPAPAAKQKDIALYAADEFPKLNPKTAKVVGLTAKKDYKKTLAYNCIASGVGDNTRWWFPDKKDPSFFWPSAAKRDGSVASFDDLFVRLAKGSVTKDTSIEPGYIKVALYTQKGKPTHLERQVTTTGQWLSKMGAMYAIVHDTGELNHGDFGSIAKIYKVPISEFVKIRKMT